MVVLALNLIQYHVLQYLHPNETLRIWCVVMFERVKKEAGHNDIRLEKDCLLNMIDRLAVEIRGGMVESSVTTERTKWN